MACASVKLPVRPAHGCGARVIFAPAAVSYVPGARRAAAGMRDGAAGAPSRRPWRTVTLAPRVGEDRRDLLRGLGVGGAGEASRRVAVVAVTVASAAWAAGASARARTAAARPRRIARKVLRRAAPTAAGGGAATRRRAIRDTARGGIPPAWLADVQVCPSILAADFGAFRSSVQELLDAGARTFHVDVMDGQFVPVITFGTGVVAAIADVVHDAGGALAVHMMVERPERFVDDFAKAGADALHRPRRGDAAPALLAGAHPRGRHGARRDAQPGHAGRR